MKVTITAAVVVHLIATLWHGDAHTTLAIGLPPAKDLFVYVVVLAGPVLGGVLLWTRFSVLGVGIVAFSMVGALVFGAYHHYILVSPDNIAHLPIGPADAQSQFIDSAGLIAIIELVSALLAFFALGRFVTVEPGDH